MTWMKIACAAAITLTMLAQKSAPKSFLLRTDTLKWTPMPITVIPPGLEQKLLHENKEKNMMTAVVRFPKGYREPRHYHTTCGHSMLILKGRLQSPDGPLTPGAFLYSAPHERHGPFFAEQETELFFFTDGPFDFFVDDKKG